MNKKIALFLLAFGFAAGIAQAMPIDNCGCWYQRMSCNQTTHNAQACQAQYTECMENCE